MLGTFLLVLACVGSSLGAGYKEDFAKRSFKPRGSSILYQINDLISGVSALIHSDEKIDADLRDLITENELNTVLNELVTNELFPELRKQQDAQNRRLRELEDEAKSLLTLAIDLDLIRNDLKELEDQLDEASSTRKQITKDLKVLSTADSKQTVRLDNATESIDQQEKTVDGLEQRARDVMDSLSILREKLRQVIAVFNSENSQTVDITLTRDKNAVAKLITADFDGRRPDIQYGITALHVSDRTEKFIFHNPYGSPKGGYSGTDLKIDPSIYFNVDVDFDVGSNKVIARLYDLSTGGWSVDKVVVQVSAFRLDRREIEH